MCRCPENTSLTPYFLSRALTSSALSIQNHRQALWFVLSPSHHGTRLLCVRIMIVFCWFFFSTDSNHLNWPASILPPNSFRPCFGHKNLSSRCIEGYENEILCDFMRIISHSRNHPTGLP